MIDSAEVQARWKELGRQLAGWRLQAGHTQHTLAPLVSYTRSSIANIETGKQHADRAFWRRTDEILGADGTLIAGYENAEALRRRQRRPDSPGPETLDSNQHVARTAAPPSVGVLESLEVIDSRRQQNAASNVDDARLRYLHDAVLRAIADNERRPPAVLLPQVRQLRSYVDQLLAGRQHPPERARLYVLAAYLSGLLGALALDLSAFGPARSYGAEAFELADAVGDPNVQAWARAVQSLIAYYAGDFHDALAYARDGVRRSPEGPHSVRLAVNGEARALARLGDRYGVDEAVDRAFTQLHTLPPTAHVTASLTTGPYCPARTAANAATAYLTVGGHEHVHNYLTQALAAFDAAQLRGPQALSRLDLATATLQQGSPDLEQACALAVEAMTLTAGQRFESVNQRAGQFLIAARPFGNKAALRPIIELIADRSRRAPETVSALTSRP